MKLFFLLTGLWTISMFVHFDSTGNNISEACEIYVPNVFSPNGDALNDVFLPSSNCSFASFEMKVYSRWGSLVYSTNSATEGWNGASGGEPSPADVYAWVISYTFQPTDSLSTGKLSGDVALIR